MMDLVGAAAHFLGQPLEVGVECLRRRLLHMRGEHRLGMARGEAAAGVRRAGLDQHRPPLRAARDVERPGDLVEVAGVVDRPDAVRARVDPALPVVQHGIRRPAVPQALRDLQELLRPGIAFRVADLAGVAVVGGRRRRPGGDDVPADPAAADEIQRGELPGEVVGLGIGGRGRRDQPDAAGRERERAERGDRLQPDAGRALHVLAHGELVRQEDGVEQPGLRAAREILVVADVGERQRRSVGMAPRGFVVTAAVDEEIEVELLFHALILCCDYKRVQFRQAKFRRDLLPHFPVPFEPFPGGVARN